MHGLSVDCGGLVIADMLPLFKGDLEAEKQRSKSPTEINGKHSSSVDCGGLVIADMLPTVCASSQCRTRSVISTLQGGML